MSNNINQDDFEQLLNDEVKQHRMYASDRVWRNIHKELHGDKRWPQLPIVAVLMIAALTFATVFINRPSPSFLKEKESLVGEVVTKEKIISPVVAETFKEQFSPNKVTARTLNEIKLKEQRIEDSVYNDLLASAGIPTTHAVIVDKDKIVSYKPYIVTNNTNVSSVAIAKINNSNKNKKIEQEIVARLEVDNNRFLATNSASNAKQGSKTQNKNFDKLAVAKHTFNEDAVNKSDAFTNTFAHQPITIPKKKKSNKLEWQFFVTPSASYRKLSDDKARNRILNQQTGPFNLSYTAGINDVVRHKPAIGYEVGGALLYKVSNRVRVKVGLQFNVRQYYIDAYQSLLSTASIAIVGGNGLDTMVSITSISNNNGYGKTKLDNKLYQISTPLGFEYDILHFKKFAVTAGATIQPTYTLNKSLYVISTDYKYYTNGDPYLRKWNINSSVELNLSYKVGDYKIFVGPQVRYQHLPTYSDLYPIKEHRLDYGLKIGFTKPIF